MVGLGSIQIGLGYGLTDLWTNWRLVFVLKNRFKTLVHAGECCNLITHSERVLLWSIQDNTLRSMSSFAATHRFGLILKRRVGFLEGLLTHALAELSDHHNIQTLF